MKTWIKYLIIGWSIVCVGVVIVSFQIMKNHFIEERYEIVTMPKDPATLVDEVFGKSLFYSEKYGDFADTITKEAFVDRIKKSKSVDIQSQHKVKDNFIYLALPLYAFTIWAIPILVFSVLGSIFGKRKE